MIYHEFLGRGQCVILLHGWGFDSQSMRELAMALSLHYRVMLVDLPGFGKSNQGPDVDDLEAMAKMLMPIIPAEAIIIGWSLGGLIAMKLSQMLRLKALILISSSPCFVSTDNWPGVKGQLLKQFSERLIAHTDQTIDQFAYLQVQGLPNASRLYLKVKKAISVKNVDKKVLLNTLKILETSDFRNEELNCPVQFILGEHDALVPAILSEAVSQIWPKAKAVILKGRGHMPFLNDVMPVKAVIDEFIRTIDAS